MQDCESVFCGVESVVGEMLDPERGVLGGEHAQSDLEHVHVDEGYLGPVYEVGG